jgi:hypothetical protein
MIIVFPFGLRAVMATLAVASNASMIKAGGHPAKSTVTTLAVLISLDMAAVFTRRYGVVVTAKTGLVNTVVVKAGWHPGNA